MRGLDEISLKNFRVSFFKFSESPVFSIVKFAARSNARKHDVLKFMKGDVKFKMSVEGAGEVEAWDKDHIKCLEIGTMTNMYKHRWGLIARMLSYIKPFREACRMFVFALGKRG